MRLDSLTLSWFRGAAVGVTLEPNGESMVVYGENGAGKSSFIDAIEYLLNGRVGHQSHEYSGRNQERSVINTHRPDGVDSTIAIKFKGESELRQVVGEKDPPSNAALDSWLYGRTVLRQDEVARFIAATKSTKYSTLLPLLGLQDMEAAAANLRQLVHEVEKKAKLQGLRAIIAENVAPDASSDEAEEAIRQLYESYVGSDGDVVNPLERCDAVDASLGVLRERLLGDDRRQQMLREACDGDLVGDIAAVHTANDALADGVEPLLAERVAVLERAATFAERSEGSSELDCPACGQALTLETLRGHVAAERERLSVAISAFEERKVSLAKLATSVRRVSRCLGAGEVASWRDDLEKPEHVAALKLLNELDPEQLRIGCDAPRLAAIESQIVPLVACARQSSLETPADAGELSDVRERVEAARVSLRMRENVAAVARAEALIAHLRAIESQVRSRIRRRTQEIIAEISTEVREMWTLIHPGSRIEDVRLSFPEDADKAIDIGLKFHGVEQASPRMTLSEGNRNSLGLCIFLAMARRDKESEHPVILDDVIVSLDRNHRGAIVDILVKYFTDRQVLVFTHDREWASELRKRLLKRWKHKALMPYQSPELGVRWSERTWSFDDARAQLELQPDAAGNTARKIMDLEMSQIAEQLRVRMPYHRAEANDHRTAFQFLERVGGDAKKCLQVLIEEDRESDGEWKYRPNVEGREALGQAAQLLVTFGNKASHTFDVSRPEAEELINTCERALAVFRCGKCKQDIFRVDDKDERALQCRCGNIRWQYKKLS